MTVPRLTEITHYQKQHPPVHLLVQGAVGGGEKRGSTDMSAFVAEMVGLGAVPTPAMMGDG